MDNLEARKPIANKGYGRAQQQAHHKSAHKDHEQIADPDRNPVIGLDGVVGQHVAEYAAPVQRGNRQQVEEEKRQVDQNRY